MSTQHIEEVNENQADDVAAGLGKHISEQPTKPLFLILLYQISAVTISDQTRVQLKSAVTDRKKPVIPIKLPNKEDRKIVPI